MNAHVRDVLKEELIRSGYIEDGEAINPPQLTMSFSIDFLSSCAITELFDMAITRREKLNRMLPDDSEVRPSIEDVELLVGAIKVAIEKLIVECNLGGDSSH